MIDETIHLAREAGEIAVQFGGFAVLLASIFGATRVIIRYLTTLTTEQTKTRTEVTRLATGFGTLSARVDEIEDDVVEVKERVSHIEGSLGVHPAARQPRRRRRIEGTA
ncbi:MAG: hypothetical protein AB7E70_20370 [Hyphomicrobiaceae bacterium]